ncbi:MAG: deoxynucleoside kinase, partial [Bacteroidota bacterium]
LIFERFADNPFLPKFYKDPDRYSFPLELSFLAERYNQLKNELGNLYLFNSFVIADYFFMKSLIFAKQTLPDDEFQLYRQLFNIIYKSLPKPDLYVYLHLEASFLMENIKKRGREYEQEISEEYLLKIQEGYFSFFRQHPDLKILIIDTKGLDFVGNENHFKLVHDCIFEKDYPAGIHRIIP